jgi:predicted nucleic acid-binding protein
VKRNVILDTGPLVALINGADRDHSWSVQQWGDIEPPMLTCESVISEACFLLNQIDTGTEAVFEMLSRKTVDVPFSLQDHSKFVRALLRKYSDVPMSVADACLVRMAEQIPDTSVFTLDGDFRIYRKHGREVISLIMPERVKS